MKKIAFLNIKNFIATTFASLITEEEVRYDITFFDDNVKEINCYNKIYYTQKLDKFESDEFDVIINLSDLNIDIKDNQMYFDNNNIMPSTIAPLVKIINLYKKSMVNFDLIINKSVISNGIEAMHSFFREIKDYAIKTVYTGYHFEQAIAYNMHEKTNNYNQHLNLSFNYSIKTIQSSVIKVNTLFFYFNIKKNLTQEDFIKDIKTLDIDYKDDVDSIKLDNENYVIASNFQHLYENKYCFTLMFDDLRNGCAKYILDKIETN